MTSLLTLDHTTLFFYTLCSQCHTTSVEHWRTSIDTKINPGSEGASTIPTAPSLIHTSTRSSTSKRQSAASYLVIDLCGPTPKRPRTQGPKTTTINSKVKVVVHDNDDDDLWGGGLSDEKEMDCPEAVAAHLSPLKNGARATSSVSNIHLYFHILITLIGSRLSQNRGLSRCCSSSSATPSPDRSSGTSTPT